MWRGARLLSSRGLLLLLLLMVAMTTTQTHADEDETSNEDSAMVKMAVDVNEEEGQFEASAESGGGGRSGDGDRQAGTPHHHRRIRRQLLDGFRLHVDGLLAMENLDEMLRSTIPEVDRFNCVERIMCSIAAAQQAPPEPEVPPLGQFPGFDPSFQQGVILDPSTIQQSLSGLAQPGLQQSLQGLVQGQGIQNLVQSPAFQQGIQGLQQQQQQVFPSFQQHGQTFHPQHIVGLQGATPQFQGGTNFQNSFLGRENPEVSARTAASDTNAAASAPVPAAAVPPPPHPSMARVPVRKLSAPLPPLAPRPARRRWPHARRRPQRRGFLDTIRRSFGRRKKRDLLSNLTNLFSGLSNARFLGLMDQMMSSYSFYPYTHAAFMGLSGTPERCQSLYPSCPSTAEDMIDLFNNIHKHYPNGIPFKDNLPWPLNVILP